MMTEEAGGSASQSQSRATVLGSSLGSRVRAKVQRLAVRRARSLEVQRCAFYFEFEFNGNKHLFAAGLSWSRCACWGPDDSILRAGHSHKQLQTSGAASGPLAMLSASQDVHPSSVGGWHRSATATPISLSLSRTQTFSVLAGSLHEGVS